jgi:hypothetical protein
MMKFCKNVVFVIMIACVHGAQGMEEVPDPWYKDGDTSDSSQSIYQREEIIKGKLATLVCFSRCGVTKTALQDELDAVQLQKEEHERKLICVEDMQPYIKYENRLQGMYLQNVGGLQRIPHLRGVDKYVLSTLEIIDISNNQITHFPLGSILGWCQNLKKIDAHNNLITDITYRSDQSPYHIKTGPSLQQIILAQNRLTAFDVDALCTVCPHLQSLDISQNPLRTLKCQNTNTWMPTESACKGFNFIFGSPVKPTIQVPAELDKKDMRALREWYTQKTLAYHRACAAEIGGCVGCLPMIGQIVWITQGIPLMAFSDGAVIGTAFSCLAWPFISAGVAHIGACCCVSREEAQIDAEANVRTHRNDV